MRFDVVTIFPGLFESFLRESLIGKALENKLFEVCVIDIREFAGDRHHTADDRPFGGGPGMVLKPEPLAGAIRYASNGSKDRDGSRVILLSPSGVSLRQSKVEELSRLDHLVLVCGRYEGVDDRIRRTLVDEEISIGDYVVAGGETPAMVLIEAVGRLIPGVVGKFESTEEESFSAGLLEYPHFTRPRVFEGLQAPEVLLSGNHDAIRTWRLEESLRRTWQRRPELLDGAILTPEEERILKKIREEED